MMMYAIIKTGGKQHRVTEGQMLKVEKLAQGVGQPVKFNNVLMVAAGDELYIGTPSVKNAAVTAEVVDQGRQAKIEIIKFKRRKHHMKRKRHRQAFTAVKIMRIALGKAKKEVKTDGA
ncbi:50S ribosomal protein L21 [Coxiella endosymbiont of Ornithodoros amblus]|uniref:50S ribosomal protein L21 n=1 Tax=Coxiella endosymbiont of Ornithodoros amblus TaxID=1656166 RepID=UPI00244D9AE9|nr:50S ribosomal protein L21 [Coxiella endosymbiont of Ornithodoros amblus]MBW5803127.1 50S ribosomal protein L21 [Coxiella endosymbiont of Ornithodoros amblus]